MSIKRIVEEADILYPGASKKALAELKKEYEFDSMHVDILSYSNGLFLKNNCLHIFGYGEGEKYHDIKEWNSKTLWRDEFTGLIGDEIFFAETIFGDQFYYNENGKIVKFLSETAHCQVVSQNFSQWVNIILTESFELLDDDVLLDWVGDKAIKILPGSHLVPRIPFCLGGHIERNNDGYIAQSINDMHFKGQLARQLKNIKPGEKVDLTAINVPAAK